MPFVSISDLFHHNFLLCLFCHPNSRFFQFFFSQFESLSSFASHDIFDSIQMHLWWDFNSVTLVTVGFLKEYGKNDNQNMNEFHLWWFLWFWIHFFRLSTLFKLRGFGFQLQISDWYYFKLMGPSNSSSRIKSHRKSWSYGTWRLLFEFIYSANEVCRRFSSNDITALALSYGNIC